MPFLTELDTRYKGDGYSILLRDFLYQIPGQEKAIKAKRWFRTDFASIPRIFRGIITGNDNTKKPAVIHDWLYAKRKSHKYTRKECDKIFLMGMKEEGVVWWKRHMAYQGVRIGGWVAWRKYGAENDHAGR